MTGQENDLSVARDITSADVLPQARVRIPHGVVYRSFVKETVILNLESGKYHGVNPTGGRMLEALERSASISAAASALAQEYDKPLSEIQSDLFEFCQSLAERGLIVIEPA